MQNNAGKILVVDDSEDNLELYVRKLRSQHYIPTAANSGDAALELINRESFDLVLLDIKMPDLNGYQTLVRIREVSSPSELPVIMITATHEGNSAINFLSLGANDYVSKPIDFSVLFARASAQIQIKRSTDELNKWSQELEKRIEERSRELVESEARFRMLYDQNPAMYFTVTNTGKIISVNEFAAKRLGYKKEDIKDSSITDYISPDFRIEAMGRLKFAFRQAQELTIWEVPVMKKDMTTIWIKVISRIIHDDLADQSVMLLVCEDVTVQRQITEDLAYKMTHDPLTGLTSRKDFENKLNFLFGAQDEDKGKYTLCYIDLDQFKVINETSGHIAGDKLLKEIGNLIDSHVREDELLASMGGDNFVILMKGESFEESRQRAEDIKYDISEYRFNWQDKKFSVTASVGLVEISESFDSFDSVSHLLSLADAACYMAKESGRNRIHILNRENIDIQQRHDEMLWVNRVNDSLEKDYFQLWCQKIKPLSKKGGKHHYEILLRMLDNDRLIAPGNFLPAAERFGLSAKIDKWVIDKTFSWMSQHSEKSRDLYFSVNLSGQTLSNHEVLDYIKEKLQEYTVPSGNICFEITETAAIGNLKIAVDFILELKSAGCSFSLDDFGSGMSSLSYLKTLPVDYLKIDGVFVKNIVKDNLDRTLVESISDIGRAMGKEIIAEFVENDEIISLLKKIGIDYAQGYGVEKPKPIALLLEQS